MNDAAKKIVEAFIALANTLPGVESVVLSTGDRQRVTLWTKTDAAAIRLGGLLDVPLQQRPWGSNGDMRLAGDGTAGPIGLSIIGAQAAPARPLNEKKVDAALAKTEAALSEVQS